MTTRLNRPRVSPRSCSGLLVVAVTAMLVTTACISSPPLFARAGGAELRSATLQFDNQATTFVDVYLVGTQFQWRLGRVPPGMVVALRVPEAAMDSTFGFVRLAVIPASQVTAEAARDPHTVFAIALPVSTILTERWTFRQPTGAAMQLQGWRLR